MKTLPGTLRYLAAAVALLCGIIAFSCAHLQKGRAKKIAVQEHGIEIHPAAEVSQTDQSAMNTILRKYDKSLYKIQTYKNGKLESSRGGLSNVFIDKTLTSEIAQKAEAGFSYCVMQIFNLDKTHHDWDNSALYFSSHTHASPTPPPPPPPNGPNATGMAAHTHTTAQKQAQSEELIKRLKPVLEKYNSQ